MATLPTMQIKGKDGQPVRINVRDFDASTMEEWKPAADTPVSPTPFMTTPEKGAEDKTAEDKAAEDKTAADKSMKDDSPTDPMSRRSSRPGRTETI